MDFHEMMSDYEITGAMIKYGGSFVEALGQLHRLGDAINQRRLRLAFPEYWKQYSDLAERAIEQLGTQK